ncbi:unnamed protein product [Lactuca saligna]|uniref:START domain-containing protein n=1 Tax=Lactuca saligna TaxID=75948 RepID=A0AA35ZHA4_LACSI|nr:unnamed protein product [Lactuca saligna]
MVMGRGRLLMYPWIIWAHRQFQDVRRRPSGCLIQELPNGYSKVTWIEHVEVDNGDVHDIYKVLVNSGLAFGAKRWVATLDRQSERLASAMANNIPAGDVGGKCPSSQSYLS